MSEVLEKRREEVENGRINVMEDLFEVDSILFLFEEGEKELAPELRDQLFQKRMERVRNDIGEHIDILFASAQSLMEQIKAERES